MTTDPELTQTLEALQQLKLQAENAIALIESGMVVRVPERENLEPDTFFLGDFVVRRRFFKPLKE